jgi:hypothetical protein
LPHIDPAAVVDQISPVMHDYNAPFDPIAIYCIPRFVTFGLGGQCLE